MMKKYKLLTLQVSSTPFALPVHNIELSSIPFANLLFLFVMNEKFLSHSFAEIVFNRTFNKCVLTL